MTLLKSGDKTPKLNLIFTIISLTLASWLGASPAIAAGAVFDNAVNIKSFKSKIPKDIFYLPGEKFAETFSAISKPSAKQETEQAQSSNDQQRQAPKPGETFKVEGIIKIGERGCAVINSKIWYVGKNNFGYTLYKLGEDYVDIKTPDGKIIKVELIKKKAVE